MRITYWVRRVCGLLLLLVIALFLLQVAWKTPVPATVGQTVGQSVHEWAGMTWNMLFVSVLSLIWLVGVGAYGVCLFKGPSRWGVGLLLFIVEFVMLSSIQQAYAGSPSGGSPEKSQLIDLFLFFGPPLVALVDGLLIFFEKQPRDDAPARA